ncbi:MAG TPA: cytochrome C assembly protein, partial [Armatimonadota bacterium]
TFAFLSWAVYLIYLHTERYTKLSPRRHLTLAACAFLMIPACWLVVNYLPTAVNSVHTYSMQ